MTKCSHCDQPVHPLQETCGSCGERLRDRREDRGARSGELGEDERGMTARPGEGERGMTARRGEDEEEGPPPSNEDERESAPLPGEDEREGAPPSNEDTAGNSPGGAKSALEGAPGGGGARDELPSLRPPYEAPPSPLPGATPPPSFPRRPTPKRPSASAPAFLSRFWALVVDFALLSVASSVLPAAIRLGIRAAEAVSGTPEMYDDLILAKLGQLAWFGLLAGYFVFVPAAGGQTIGKGLMGLVVVRLDGAPMDVRTALLRAVGYAFSFASLGIGFLFAAFPPRRGLHDYVAGTIVLRLRDLPSSEREEVQP